jgi:hypothetical protein
MRRLVITICFLFSVMVAGWAQQLSLPVKPNSVRFAAIGDMGTGDGPQYEVAQQMVQFRQKFPFDFVIMLGDNIYGGHSPGDFEQKFTLPYKSLLDAGVKFYAALGNHDDPNERFFQPFNMGGSRYYAYKKGNVRFVVLDSDYMDPPQFQWLENELQKGSGNEWKICYFHHPLYSSGKTHGSSVELRGQIEPLFIRYGVNAVFSGHDHVYERVRPQHGIYYFTEGSAGQLRNGDLRKTDMTEKGFDRDQTFMLVEIAGDDMYFQTVSRTGTTVDSGAVPKQTVVKPAAVLRAIPAPAPTLATLVFAPSLTFSGIASRPVGFLASAQSEDTQQANPGSPEGEKPSPQPAGPVPAKIIPPEPPIKPKPHSKRRTKRRKPKKAAATHSPRATQ